MYKQWEIGTVLAVLSGLSLLSFANYTYAAPQDDIMQRQQQVLQQQ